MEIRQLRYFMAVATARHFGRAADQLHINQSPLSHAIRQLEAQVGASLFTRTTRRVDLTPAGEALLVDARRILDTIDAAQERVQRVGEGHSGVLRVGSTGLAALKQLPQLARIATRELPALILRFSSDMLTPASEAALLDERVDVALLRPPLRHNGLDARLVARERFVVAVPDHHRLADGDPVELGELRDEDFVSYGAPESVVNSVITQACLERGFLPRRTHEAAETSVMLTLVAAGLGVALLPGSALALRVEGVRYVPVADDIHVDLALAWRSGDTDPALARLLEALEANGFTTVPTLQGAPR